MLVKTLYSPGGEQKDELRYITITVLQVVQHALTSACLILHHQFLTICAQWSHEWWNVYDMYPHMAREKEHSNNFLQEKSPNWDYVDSRQLVMNIKVIFSMLCGTSGTPCSYMIPSSLCQVQKEWCTGAELDRSQWTHDQALSHHPHQCSFNLLL